jgi:hypothetical protein
MLNARSQSRNPDGPQSIVLIGVRAMRRFRN